MQINLINSAEVMVLKTTGEIEIKEAEELKGYFSHLVAKATTIIIIDFERITFIGSLGIGKLLSLCKNVTLRKIPIEICKLNENLYNQSRQIIHSWEKTMIRFYPEKIQLLSGHGVYQALLHGTEYATSVIKTRDKTYLKILTVSGYYSLLFQAGELRK